MAGQFEAGEAVELADSTGQVFAKGLVRVDSTSIRAQAGQRGPAEVIHRDELVLAPVGMLDAAEGVLDDQNAAEL